MFSADSIINTLPDSDDARRFLERFAAKSPAQHAKLLRDRGLLADILTLASVSPLLAATLEQNPNYAGWLARHRAESNVRGKDELLESLGRFSLVNSTVEPQILLARFRRRELLRIFLHDIRRLTTIAEITEEISNLADAVLEFALRLAKQELDNRFGSPLEVDEKGRSKIAELSVVSLGKLGSRELNYASDIDLMFIYSADGKTSGNGSRGEVTNREYFVKLAELVTKLVGQQSGEGAAYRVDLRLRPHGRVGALALSLAETVRYYENEARQWERQVLIRSRSSAGDQLLYREFTARVGKFVFSKDVPVAEALGNVRLSKEKIDSEKTASRGFDVKLGRGGIREIEFIAQALQLAYGGGDEWIRSPHTLIALTRLADRGKISPAELTELFEAYDFLRRVEHLLQMENGLQTHLLPDEPERRKRIADRMSFVVKGDFEADLVRHTGNVSRIFSRVFATSTDLGRENTKDGENSADSAKVNPTVETDERVADDANHSEIEPIISSLAKSGETTDLDAPTMSILHRLAHFSPPFSEIVAANPSLIRAFPDVSGDFDERNYREILLSVVRGEADFARRLAALRQRWSELMLEIVIFDLFDRVTRKSAKVRQTRLAEASIEAAIFITKSEIERRMSVSCDDFGFAVLGLGKLGGGGMDYGSDLDLVLVYDDEKEPKKDGVSHAEFYARVTEIFVTTLSSMTREGNLYRVDLRLRPDGKNGATSIGKNAFLEYLRSRAAMWEWLAYVKLRSAAGDLGLGDYVEGQTQDIIHQRASAAARSELRDETVRVRNRLEEEKAKTSRSREIDIKFGAGGMLDVYFAMRFIQLRDNVPDDPTDRSSKFMLKRLRELGSIAADDYDALARGYIFLAELDHNIRISAGRSTRLPLGNERALRAICERMKFASTAELLEQLTLHRLNIRNAFESVVA